MKGKRGSSVKKTPSTCRFLRCEYNPVAPPVGSQECIGCEGLKKEGGK